MSESEGRSLNSCDEHVHSCNCSSNRVSEGQFEGQESNTSHHSQSDDSNHFPETVLGASFKEWDEVTPLEDDYSNAFSHISSIPLVQTQPQHNWPRGVQAEKKKMEYYRGEYLIKLRNMIEEIREFTHQYVEDHINRGDDNTHSWALVFKIGERMKIILEEMDSQQNIHEDRVRMEERVIYRVKREYIRERQRVKIYFNCDTGDDQLADGTLVQIIRTKQKENVCKREQSAVKYEVKIEKCQFEQHVKEDNEQQQLQDQSSDQEGSDHYESNSKEISVLISEQQREQRLQTKEQFLERCCGGYRRDEEEVKKQYQYLLEEDDKGGRTQKRRIQLGKREGRNIVKERLQQQEYEQQLKRISRMNRARRIFLQQGYSFDHWQREGVNYLNKQITVPRMTAKYNQKIKYLKQENDYTQRSNQIKFQQPIQKQKQPIQKQKQSSKQHLTKAPQVKLQKEVKIQNSSLMPKQTEQPKPKTKDCQKANFLYFW